jgi:hypothetical protein
MFECVHVFARGGERERDGSMESDEKLYGWDRYRRG